LEVVGCGLAVFIEIERGVPAGRLVVPLMTREPGGAWPVGTIVIHASTPFRK
jgi:hypothetical protein